MEAKELRIGNLVISNNKKYRPDKFGKNCIISAIDTNRPKIKSYSGISCTLYVYGDEYQDSFGQMIEFIKPIPLTEKLLLKLDAIKLEFKNYPCFNLKGLQISYIDGMWIEYVSRIEITGLHHLQNIFYFRMNEELTIK